MSLLRSSSCKERMQKPIMVLLVIFLVLELSFTYCNYFIFPKFSKIKCNMELQLIVKFLKTRYRLLKKVPFEGEDLKSIVERNKECNIDFASH